MKNLLILSVLFLLFSCKNENVESSESVNDIAKKVEQFAEFELSSDLSDLSDNQKEMLLLFFEAAKIMDNLFWQQSFGNKEKALALTDNCDERKFIAFNYGPWERLNGNAPFINGVEAKPLGAQFYPEDMSKKEFEAFESNDKTSLYTIIERNDDGSLKSVPYHAAYKDELTKVSELLKKASELAEDPGFKTYLELRSKALLTSDYFESDLAWMDMKTNRIDFVVGPIENYEDRLFNYKAAFEAYILLKDIEWSKKLDRFATLLPELQKKLPVADEYKSEVPGTNSDLGAYDVIYYAGDCNAGSKTIAINLPNDPEVHKQKGSRRLQLKNAMEAKYEKILVPISKTLITSEQQKHVTFDAFFENTMLHEVAHGIGVHYVISSGGTVSDSLKDKSSAIEEGKADILGIFLVKELIDMGELDTDLMDNYVTFMTGIFRSVRFGASSAHGVSNLVRYNYFKELDAFSRNEEGIYTVDAEKMQIAIDALTNEILTIQGDGNYDAAIALIEKYGIVTPDLKADLETINNNNIPVDITFNQGACVVGLKDCEKKTCCKDKKSCSEKK